MTAACRCLLGGLSPAMLRRLLVGLISLSACGLLFSASSSSSSYANGESSRDDRAATTARRQLALADKFRPGLSGTAHAVVGVPGLVIGPLAAAVASRESANVTVEDVERAYIGCMQYRWQQLSRHRENSADMQPAKCVRLCRSRGHAYAALVGRAACHCSAWTGDGALRADGRCSGVGDHADVYSTKLGSGDGDDSSWSTWMTVARTTRSRTAEYASRFRQCRPVAPGSGGSAAAAATTSTCLAPVMRRRGGGLVPEIEFASYVGCFVFGREPAATAVRSDGTARGCASRCAALATKYALMTSTTSSGFDRNCRCADSLGIARPFYRCGVSPPGVAVYLTASPSPAAGGGAVLLVFDAPPESRRKALLLTHHAGGARATLPGRLLAVDERATHVVEPERVFEADDLASDGARRLSRRTLARLLRRYLACDAQRLPAAWLALYAQASGGGPGSPPPAAAANPYQRCRLAHGVEACVPAFRAVCEASSTVSAATVLLTDATALRQFVADNNDTVVFHVMRDPLAVAALIKKSSPSRGRRPLSGERAAALCSALKQTRAAAAALAASGHSVYNVHFEEVPSRDDDPLASALLFYQRLSGGGGGGEQRPAAVEHAARERVQRLVQRLNATLAAADADERTPPLSVSEQSTIERACENFVYGE